jgi:hypothetical protein
MHAPHDTTHQRIRQVLLVLPPLTAKFCRLYRQIHPSLRRKFPGFDQLTGNIRTNGPAFKKKIRRQLQQGKESVKYQYQNSGKLALFTRQNPE